METKYNVVRFTINNGMQKAGFHTIGKDLNLAAAQTLLDDQERLSKLFADGTYHRIIEAN
jgi:hypothetical protein